MSTKDNEWVIVCNYIVYVFSRLCLSPQCVRQHLFRKIYIPREYFLPPLFGEVLTGDNLIIPLIIEKKDVVQPLAKLKEIVEGILWPTEQIHQGSAMIDTLHATEFQTTLPRIAC